MEVHEAEVHQLGAQLEDLNKTYHSVESASLAKDATVLKKKYETTVQKSVKVEQVLYQTMQQHLQESVQEQTRWLNASNEKVAWCSDVSGDKYSVEAKLATIQV